MASGIPAVEKEFWQSKCLHDIYAICLALYCCPAKVTNMIAEPAAINSNEDQVFNYLLQYVGNMRAEELRKFLRFSISSSVMISDKINVVFNNLSGLGRRLIAHTCTIEIPTTYLYVDHEEVNSILSDEYSWQMDAN